MKKPFFPRGLSATALSAFALFGVIACGPSEYEISKNRKPVIAEVVDVAEILKSKNLPEKKKAERLALAGEKLVSPIGFMYANEVFDKVLSLDPNHRMALFYKAFTNPLMVYRGILKRIEPLMAKSTEGDKYQHDKRIANLAPGGLKDFLLDGTPDIHNEKELQAFLIKARNELDKFRLFLQDNKDLLLSLKINYTRSSVYRSCSVVKTEDGNYKQSPCDSIYIQERQVDRADIEIMQHIVAGLEIYLGTITAYDARGAQALHVEKDKRHLTEQEVFEFLEAQGQFGALQDEKGLSLLPALGTDMLAGAKWAYKIQPQLCPLGDGGGGYNRPNYFFNDGVCMTSATAYGTPAEKIFDMLEVALAGMTQVYDFRDGTGRDSVVVHTTDFDPVAPFLRPQANVKALFPSEFDHCGDSVGFKDKTFGGMFPQGDVDEAFLKVVLQQADYDVTKDCD